MNPKEKANDLLLRYSILKEGHNHLVIQCAIICVEEILEFMRNEDIESDTCHYANAQSTRFYEEVLHHLKSMK